LIHDLGLPIRVGIIGCGTIGTQLALAVDARMIDNASIEFLFDMNPDAFKKLQIKLRHDNPACFSDFSDLVNSLPFEATELVVESASQRAVKAFGKKIIEANKDLMIMSVGALASEELLSELLGTLSLKRGHLILPSGAIAGIDAIRSVKRLLKSVTLVTTKNPKSLEGAPFFDRDDTKLKSVTEKTIVYEGNARDAVVKFPANVNVAAILALAGIGFEKTQVRIVADPKTNQNQHQIIAAGEFGEIEINVNNTPSSSNPKTSLLAVLSAIECLRSICQSKIRIGS
jgi:aspartate dehydrogenase